MNADNKKFNRSNFFSWLTLFLAAFTFTGILIFPQWWHRFILDKQFLNIKYWIDGISSLLMLILYNPILLVLIAGLIILIWSKRISVKLPAINIFRGIKVIIPAVLPFILALIIWTSSRVQNPFDAGNIPGMDTEETQKIFIAPPVDFYYLNERCINNLYNQIKPEMVLKETKLEKQYRQEKGIAGGGAYIGSEKREASTQKETNSYRTEEVTLPKRAIRIMNHFYSRGLSEQYETLEVASEELKKLEDFKSISEQYKIKYNKENFATVYSRILNEQLVKESKHLKQMEGQIIAKGIYEIEISKNNIYLKHSYTAIDKIQGIDFIITPIALQDKNLISATLKDKSLDGKQLNLTVFGKVIRQDEATNATEIYMEPYAIW